MPLGVTSVVFVHARRCPPRRSSNWPNTLVVHLFGIHRPEQEQRRRRRADLAGIGESRVERHRGGDAAHPPRAGRYRRSCRESGCLPFGSACVASRPPFNLAISTRPSASAAARRRCRHAAGNHESPAPLWKHEDQVVAQAMSRNCPEDPGRSSSAAAATMREDVPSELPNTRLEATCGAAAKQDDEPATPHSRSSPCVVASGGPTWLQRVHQRRG